MTEESTGMDIDKPVEEEKKEEKEKEKTKTGGEPSASEENASKYPDMALAQKIHRLSIVSGSSPLLDAEGAAATGIKPELSKEVMGEICGEEVENPSLYKSFMTSFGWTKLSEADLAAMEEKHKKKLKDLEKKVEEAKESAGDMEVLAAHLEIARFAAKSLSKDEALEAYEKVMALPKLSSGKKIDSLMESSRVASFYGDSKKGADLVDRASKLAEEGGDWDRRNRLKVYKALSFMLARDMKKASELLIDCIATFSCNELCTYPEFIVYAIITNIMHLPRPDLKKKIIDGPEILSVASDIPVVIRLVSALYDCDYKAYLNAMVDVQPFLLADRFFQPHAGYIMRELHVLGYKQFLDSYKSVTLESMADSFGVGVDFLDFQLSRFIAAGRLTAKIDKFGGVVETNRPDLKNAQYREMIQKGDGILNRIAKLARDVDL